MSHDELAADLAAYMRGMSKRITWLDMQLGESGSPRPDVYTMEPTYTRMSFEAFECKISKADFRADVTAGKWQSYLRYANCVTFAAPIGLLTKADVPSTCGLILRGETGQWRYAKRPVRNVLTELPWKAWVKLLLDGVTRSEFERRTIRFREHLAEKKLADKFGIEVGAMVHEIRALPKQLEYHRTYYAREVETMNAHIADAKRRAQEERERSQEKCSDALHRLAIALGLPKEDCNVRDLNTRAEQILRLLGAPQDRWRADRLIDVAESMERLSKELRLVGQVLKQNEVPES